MREPEWDDDETGEETREELEKRYRRALDAAGRQLSYRALSETAMRRKLLEKGHAEDAAEYAVAWLLERGMLNDAELAESAVRALSRKGYGIRRIRQELRRRGIPDELAAEALEAFEADTDRLCRLLDKRLRGDLSDRREVQKAIAALQRRGFLWEDIRRALDAYGDWLEGESEDWPEEEEDGD